MSEEFVSTVDYHLHQLVFENNVDELTKLLEKCEEDVFANLFDSNGNSALHLAVMLGHKECIQLLIKHGHPLCVKSTAGWYPLQEAVSYGHRPTIKTLLIASNDEKKIERKNRKPDVKKALANFGGDFFVKMTWDFQSWLPFVSRILPSDECKIYRQGNKVRMDSTLEDFTDKHWVRGDLSYLINFEDDGDSKIYLLDNKKKEYFELQQATPEEKDACLDETVDFLMSNDISDGTMRTSRMVIDRVSTGWIFRHNKVENVGQFEADFYKLNGLVLETKKRREHLTDEDIKRNKLIQSVLSPSESTQRVLEECEEMENIESRKSLPAPTSKGISWDEYLTGSCTELGREKKEKTSHKNFEATLGISQKFPIKLEDLLPILEALGPKAKVFAKLRDFVTLHLPAGFPVRVDIPIFPTVKATVTFPEFQFRNDLPPSMFEVPSTYTRLPPDYYEKKAKENGKLKKKSK